MSFIRFMYALTVLLFSYSHSFAQLTVTEELIRDKIISLGGDWESGARPVLVAFCGTRFEAKHFEMLMHLPTVRIFAATDCNIDSYAIKCLSQVKQLERLEIERCTIDIQCLSLLRGNRKLVELHLTSMKLPQGFVSQIPSLVQIKTLAFEDISISQPLLESVSKMHHLKECSFFDCEGLTEIKRMEIEMALPNTTIK